MIEYELVENGDNANDEFKVVKNTYETKSVKHWTGKDSTQTILLNSENVTEFMDWADALKIYKNLAGEN